MTHPTPLFLFRQIAALIYSVAFAGLTWAQSTGPLADEPVKESTEIESVRQDRWVLGGTVGSTPTYTGGMANKLGFRPVLAGRVGRWMLSSSSARALADMDLAGGISTTVIQDSRWRVGVGARLTHGRRSSDDAMLTGLPDVRSSLGLRTSVGYALTPKWRLSGSMQQDLFRGQGLRGNLGLGWSTPLSDGWALSVGGGLGWANARAMQTFYGVAPEQARAGRPAWTPTSGLESVGLSLGVSRPLSAHWRLAGNVGQNTLLGDAAHSPLTLRRTARTAQVTLAYVGW
jgi:MipA family protein